MARVSVIIRDDLLHAVDAEAEREGISRSALLRKAVGAYLEKARRLREETGRRRTMQEASARMDELAERLGEWDPVRIIRRFRDPWRGSSTK